MPAQEVADLPYSFRIHLTSCYVKAWKAKVAEAERKGTIPCCPDCDGIFTMRYGPHEAAQRQR